MGDKITLKIEAREVHGKKLGQIRKEGLVPGVVYGAGIDAISVQAIESDVLKVVKKAGQHTPVQLVGKKRRIAMIKNVDRDPVKNTIRHISFHAVRADEPVEAEVPIRLVGEGESVAERNGLVILQAIEKLEVKALPLELPEALEVSMVASVAGTISGGRLTRARPYRAPHHSASMAALVGGGLKARPGEVSLAHLGVLFLDELPEFHSIMDQRGPKL